MKDMFQERNQELDFGHFEFNISKVRRQGGDLMVNVQFTGEVWFLGADGDMPTTGIAQGFPLQAPTLRLYRCC